MKLPPELRQRAFHRRPGWPHPSLISIPRTTPCWGSSPESDAADVDEAISAARAAFDEGPWSATPAAERAAKLFKLADLIEKNAEEFARRDTLNNGKPLREARFDAADTAGCFRYFAGLATKPHGQTYEVGDPNIPFPIRPRADRCVRPDHSWNYPVLMAAWKLAPGLAAGNCCILKPGGSHALERAVAFRTLRRSRLPRPAACNSSICDPASTAPATLVDKERHWRVRHCNRLHHAHT